MTDTSLEERLQSFVESEGKSCSFDPELITPEYVYRMWGGSVAIDDIKTALVEIKKEPHRIDVVPFKAMNTVS